MRILVCGGRDYHNREYVFRVLDTYHKYNPISCIIEGECHTAINADKIARQWAQTRGVPFEPYPVDNVLDGPWPAAGMNRNKRMLDQSHPQYGLAFGGGNGTQNMIDRLKRKGLTVDEYDRN